MRKKEKRKKCYNFKSLYIIQYIRVKHVMSNRKLVPIHNDWSSGGKGRQALLA